MPDTTANPLPIDVVSDVVCPWCFIGKHRLEQAIAQKPDIPVTVRWRPFFLNPWVPREGMSRADYLTKKFGSVERYNANVPRMVATAAAEGLIYAADKIARQPNTIDCHRLIRWAGANAGEMKQRLMELYFSQGADLSDREVLVAAAAACGLDPDDMRAQLSSDLDVEAVTQEAEHAKSLGIEGVPCFILGGMVAISGAQPADYLAGAIEEAAAEFDKRTAGVEIVDVEGGPY